MGKPDDDPGGLARGRRSGPDRGRMWKQLRDMVRPPSEPSPAHPEVVMEAGHQIGEFLCVARPLRGAYEKFLLKDAEGRRFLFKPDQRQGFTSVEARKAVAAHRLAQFLGVDTPEVKLVTFRGRQGSLQMWEDDTSTLAELAFGDRELWTEIKQSPAYLAARDTMDLFDLLVGNADRHDGNLLVYTTGQRGIHPQFRLIAIDHDLTFPEATAGTEVLGTRGAVEEFRKRVGRIPASPEFASKLGELARDGVLLGLVGDLLAPLEMEGLGRRLGVMVRSLALSSRDWSTPGL